MSCAWTESWIALLLARLILSGSYVCIIASTAWSAVNMFIQMLGRGVNTMIFDENISYIVLLAGLLIGVVAIAFISYYFRWQVYMKKQDTTVKFDVNYLVASILVIVMGAAAGYVCVFYGLDYVYTEKVIMEAELAFLIALVVGAGASWFMDAAFFHGIADGTVAIKYNKAQEEARALLASEAAQAALFSAIAEKATALGLVDETKVKMLAGMVENDANNSQFALYVSMLKQTDVAQATTAGTGE